jgi:hypothetical protein
MGLFGGGNSKSTSLTTQNDNRSVTDASRGGTVVQDGGRLATTVHNSRTVTTTDSGSVRNAFDFARASSVQAFKSSDEALGAVARAYADAKGGSADVMRYALIAVAIVGGLAALAPMLRGR